MGTDIHLYLERKGDDGTWTCLVPPVSCNSWLCDGTYYATEVKNTDPPLGACAGVTCPACLGSGRDLRWWRERNYDVFAILADIRNGFGFGGVDTGDGFRVIAPPRGLPWDCSAVVRGYNAWGHTPSWLRLSEILAFDWTQVSRHRGVVPLLTRLPGANFEELTSFEQWIEQGRGEPASWMAGISGTDVTIVNELSAQLLLAKRDTSRALETIYVRIEWLSLYRDCAASFLACVTEHMLPLGTPETLRIVFGFDS